MNVAIDRDEIVEALEECIFKVNEGCRNVEEVRENLLGLVDQLYCEDWSDEVDEEEDDE
jgi:hypothetical protein